MKRRFDEELKKLKKKLLNMSSLVEENISLSIKALVDRNTNLIEGIFKSEEKINMLEIEIDELSLKLLALYQPAATDLRFITSVMKINGDLERIADLAVNIAQRAQDSIKHPSLKLSTDIPQMAELAQKMVKDSIDALVNKDPELARDICKRDDVVDDLNNQIFRKFLTYMMENAEDIEQSLDLILVSRHLERIADHATNVAEDVIYFLKGKTIKHHIENLRKEK